MVNLLGKFGLDHCDMPTMLRNVGVLLKGGTININRNVNQKTSWISYIITIFSACCYIYIEFSMVWFLMVRYPETKDFVTATVELSLTMCSCTSVPKFLYMKLYSNTVMDLVDEYLRCDKLVVKDTRFAKTFLKMLRIIKKRAMTVCIMLYCDVIIYVSMPLLLPGRHFCEDLYILYGLEPMFESPHYEMSMVIMTAGVYFASSVVTHITLFLIVIVGYIEAQMLALSEELTNIWDDSEKFYHSCKLYNKSIHKDNLRNMILEKRLRDVVKFHIMNINLRNKVDREFRVILVLDFVFMILAIVTELIGGLQNTFVQLPFTICQVFMDCFIGQKLIDASDVFERAVYSCKWENYNVSNQKTILFLFLCSQKTMTLSAGGFAILNYFSLMFFMKTTYSVYTTLQTSA